MTRAWYRYRDGSCWWYGSLTSWFDTYDGGCARRTRRLCLRHAFSGIITFHSLEQPLTEEPPRKQILLTNDDGIRSPGLWAAAAALAPLGYVTVAAPLNQWSGAGRSMPYSSEGRIYEESVTVGGQTWKVYAVDGTPAQAVQHGLMELMPAYPDLIVAGINYGENVGSGVTISGTVGAALEGASFGVPGLAVSLQTDSQYHLSHSTDVDFAAAG